MIVGIGWLVSRLAVVKLKLLVILAVSLSYPTVHLTSGAASWICRTNLLSICETVPDGIDPPHAVDISGKTIPESSAVQPDKPIILAKDSQDEDEGNVLRMAYPRIRPGGGHAVTALRVVQNVPGGGQQIEAEAQEHIARNVQRTEVRITLRA